MIPTVREERTVAELFGDLARETSTLVRQEVKLATTELQEKAAFAGKQAALVAAAGLLGVVSMLTLIAALVLALGMLIPLWTSALLVGASIGIASVILASVGLTNLKHFDPKPRQTVYAIEETKQWAQHQVR